MPAAVNGMKECSKCHEVKPVGEFYSNKSRPDGVEMWCKECRKEYKKVYREKHKDKIAKYERDFRKANPREMRERHLRYKEKHPENLKESKRRYRENNLEKCREWNRSSYKRERDRIKAEEARKAIQKTKNKNNYWNKRDYYIGYNKSRVDNLNKAYVIHLLSRDFDKKDITDGMIEFKRAQLKLTRVVRSHND